MTEPGTDSEEMRLASHGGPAFSRPASEDKFNQENYPPQRGMSLRDYFAAKALAALIVKIPLFDRLGEHGVHTAEAADIHQVRLDVAESAYDYADAMLAQRAKQ